MKDEYHKYTLRMGSDITKEFVVQAENQEEARQLVELAILRPNETIMEEQDVTHKMGENERLQEFVDRLHDVDALICTGGKYITTVKSN